MNWFINKVWANNNSIDQGNPLSLIIMLVIFAVIFYFTIFRPQQKRNKNHKELLNSIEKGDEILTSGGLVGRVLKVTETGYIFIMLNEKNTNTSGNVVLVKLDYVTSVLPKGTMKSL